MAVAEAWMKAVDDGFRVIVHVGHNCLEEAQTLARHAEKVGAAAIGACAPGFFKPADHGELVDWCAALAVAAPRTPFYYYHIPAMTGCHLKVAPFLARAAARIPSLAGVKYTYEDLEDFAACLAFGEGRYDLLFGRDELLMDAWARRALGAVGSTYNYAAPLYRRMLAHLEAKEGPQARRLQDRAVQMIAICSDVGVSHQAATKAMMAWHGVDCGPMRLPIRTIRADQAAELRRRLEAIDYFSFACLPV